MIYYYCPDITTKSAGIRVLYRHVEILAQHGMPAAILHHNVGFEMPDAPPVPVRYLAIKSTLSPGDIVAIPEGFPQVMALLKDFPVRRFAMAQNWRYLYMMLPAGVDWRAFGIERVLTDSQFIADFIAWAMGLPVHVFKWGLRNDLYYFRPEEKTPLVTYLRRKQAEMEELNRVLHSRNPQFLTRIQWLPLDNLPEADYARQIRRSAVFVSLSSAEGLPCSMFEAMSAGTLVAGYDGIGGRPHLIGGGEHQNCILAENMDYPSLAQRLEPVLADLLAGDMSRWEPIRQNGFAAAAEYSREAEEQSVVALWQKLLAG